MIKLKKSVGKEAIVLDEDSDLSEVIQIDTITLVKVEQVLIGEPCVVLTLGLCGIDSLGNIHPSLKNNKTAILTIRDEEMIVRISDESGLVSAKNLEEFMPTIIRQSNANTWKLGPEYFEEVKS